MARATLFFGGLPTEPEAKKLMERFGVLEVGRQILYDEIAEVIGVKYGTSRFRTILSSWRHRLEKEHNLRMGFEPGKGIKMLSPEERVGAAEDDVRSGVRKLRKGANEASRLPLEEIKDEKVRAQGDHLRTVAAKVYSSVVETVKALRPPKPTQALPRG